MKKITYKNSIGLLKSKAVLAIFGSFILASCGTTMGGYSETDGIYYDPNKDTIPEGIVMNDGNHVGNYYDYQQTDNQNKYLNSENRNQRWQDSLNSDWGNFTGTETYYTDWGYPYGFYSGFGMSFGFGSPWGFGGYYNPWRFGYSSPFSGYYNPYYGYYNPYYSYSPYGYYSPYQYGYGGYNSYNAPRFNNKRSGSDGSGFRTGNTAVRPNNNQSSGFRNDNPRYNSQQNNTRYNSQQQQQNNNQPRYRTSPQPNSTPRQNNTPRQEAPTYNQPSRNNSDGGGFRSGNSGGGFNSGSSSSSSGSTRSSGGFRR
ncbi:prolyl-tRNA synthetase [Chryseobacterium gotjawalense]|uniref:Prolyl-tRNA synthetase n=1 Tax=Chryseobacterium gotjawalense TaxID=3042315 RepID=A0ABY8RGM5_9FLAO|nr:prolyl-tRNA synthetase [Chryseobacterium sp. wdc7]WHF52347.1 prolyl-tRNA synthetase [Chryseobacterium sp. wdc7]